MEGQEREKGGEGKELTMESWKESEGERKARGNRENGIDR